MEKVNSLQSDVQQQHQLKINNNNNHQICVDSDEDKREGAQRKIQIKSDCVDVE